MMLPTLPIVVPLIQPISQAFGVDPLHLPVDGGAAANDFLLQCLADVTGRAVERPAVEC